MYRHGNNTTTQRKRNQKQLAVLKKTVTPEFQKISQNTQHTKCHQSLRTAYISHRIGNFILFSTSVFYSRLIRTLFSPIKHVNIAYSVCLPTISNQTYAQMPIFYCM